MTLGILIGVGGTGFLMFVAGVTQGEISNTAAAVGLCGLTLMCLAALAEIAEVKP